jgi:predicted kinase
MAGVSNALRKGAPEWQFDVCERRTLLLMAGLPGAGKTTLGLALSRALGWPLLDKDTLKSAMLACGIAEQRAGPASYELLLALGRDLIVEQHLSVILDSPAGYPRVIERAQVIVREGGARLAIILCLAGRELRTERVAGRINRLSQPMRPDGSATPGDGRQRFSHLPVSTLCLSTIPPVEDLLPEALAYLAGAGG